MDWQALRIGLIIIGGFIGALYAAAWWAGSAPLARIRKGLEANLDGEKHPEPVSYKPEAG